jgi:methionyl aminopeptidase
MYGVKPAFKTVDDYQYNTCISVNDVAVHGIPKNIPLKKGDLVSIDFGIIHKDISQIIVGHGVLGHPQKKIQSF